jgi:excisionase family DNA binding protein
MSHKSESAARANRSSADGPLALTVSEAAELVGVSRRTMYRSIEAGEVPTVQLVPGGRLYIARRTLEAWLNRESA